MAYLIHTDINARPITPNDYSGTDSQRIQAAVNEAANKRREIYIPSINANTGASLWVLDSAILLPANITVVLDNCTLKLSDTSRDNIFRSANCGFGISSFTTLSNINIIGIGSVTLQGADNPRSTGDTNKTLSLTPAGGNQSYGSDAGVGGQVQTGDWRNFMILFGYVSNFKIENITIKNPHMWAICLERCDYGNINNIVNNHTGSIVVNGNTVQVTNQDCLDLRYGCHNILIENITGFTGDDCVALVIIPLTEAAGVFGTITCTGAGAAVSTDNIYFVSIKNVMCNSDNQIIRVLNTGASYKITDLIIDGVIDNSGTAPVADNAIVIGDTGYGGVAPLGHTSRVFINNIVSRATKTIHVVGSLSESIITNVMRYEAVVSPGTVLFYDNVAFIRNVNTSNVYDYT